MLEKLGTYKQRAYFFLFLSLTVLIGSFTYLYLARVEIGEIQQQVLFDEDIMTVIYEANSDLLQAEAAERGYVTTDDIWFLNNYQYADSSFRQELETLKALAESLDERASIISELDSLGHLRLAHLDSVLQAYEQDGALAARSAILEGTGKIYMDQYTQLSTKLADFTQQRIDERKQRLSHLYFLDLEITVILGIIAALLIITFFIYFYRTQRKIEVYNEKLEVRNQELQQFSYIASHDLKEPLRMVKSFVKLLQKKYKGQLDAKADQYIHFAIDGAQRMQLLIDDLLDYSRVGRSKTKKELVDFTRILDDVQVNLSALIVQHKAVIQIGSPLPEVPAFKHEITRVFQNLISNGIKFQKIGITPEIHISCSEKKSRWLFMISDNGIGIPDDKKVEIFDIFSRIHSVDEYPGTGIGLAISKKIIERHGGKIWVESQVDQGSTFYFTTEK